MRDSCARNSWRGASQRCVVGLRQSAVPVGGLFVRVASLVCLLVNRPHPTQPRALPAHARPLAVRVRRLSHTQLHALLGSTRWVNLRAYVNRSTGVQRHQGLSAAVAALHQPGHPNRFVKIRPPALHSPPLRSAAPGGLPHAQRKPPAEDRAPVGDTGRHDHAGRGGHSAAAGRVGPNDSGHPDHGKHPSLFFLFPKLGAGPHSHLYRRHPYI